MAREAHASAGWRVDLASPRLRDLLIDCVVGGTALQDAAGAEERKEDTTWCAN